MTLQNLSSIAGVLGFFISIATFTLTRIERRKRLIIEILSGSYYDGNNIQEFETDLGSEPSELMKFRFINIGGKPLILNPDSIVITANGHQITKYKTDWLYIENIPSPLEVGFSCDVAIFKDSFEKLIGCEKLDQYCNTEEYEKTEISITVQIEDHSKKVFKCQNFKYFYYVGEIEKTS